MTLSSGAAAPGRGTDLLRHIMSAGEQGVGWAVVDVGLERGLEVEVEAEVEGTMLLKGSTNTGAEVEVDDCGCDCDGDGAVGCASPLLPSNGSLFCFFLFLAMLEGALEGGQIQEEEEQKVKNMPCPTY